MHKHTIYFIVMQKRLESKTQNTVDKNYIEFWYRFFVNKNKINDNKLHFQFSSYTNTILFVILIFAVTCPQDYNVENGSTSYNATVTYAFNQRITLTCDPGFYIKGSTEANNTVALTCSGKYTWLPQAKCTIKSKCAMYGLHITHLYKYRKMHSLFLKFYKYNFFSICYQHYVLSKCRLIW